VCVRLGERTRGRAFGAVQQRTQFGVGLGNGHRNDKCLAGFFTGNRGGIQLWAEIHFVPREIRALPQKAAKAPNWSHQMRSISIQARTFRWSEWETLSERAETITRRANIANTERIETNRFFFGGSNRK
jgi:hypothetical protein